MRELDPPIWDRAPNRGETLPCSTYQQSFGGKGANQAVMVGKLGGRGPDVADRCWAPKPILCIIPPSPFSQHSPHFLPCTQQLFSRERKRLPGLIQIELPKIIFLDCWWGELINNWQVGP